MTPEERKVMELALEALEICETHGYIPVRLTRESITAIKEALNRGAMDSSPNGEAQPAVALEQRSVRMSVDSEHLEPVAWMLTHECKSVSSEYKNALYALHCKSVQSSLDVSYCIEWIRKMAEKLDTIVSHTETWAGVDGYPMHVLTSVEMVPQLRYFLEKGIHDTFISHMRQRLDTTPPQPQSQARGLSQSKPLTDEQMKKIWYSTKSIMDWYSFQEVTRAIEEAHGIHPTDFKEKNNGSR